MRILSVRTGGNRRDCHHTAIYIYPMYRGDRQTIGRKIALLKIVEKKCKKMMMVGKWRGVRSFEGGVGSRRDHRGKKKGGGKEKKIKKK